MEPSASWFAFVKDVGFPIAGLSATGFCIWLVIKWLGNNAVKPLVESTVSLHITLQKNDTDKTIALANLARVAEEHRELTEEMRHQVEDIHRVVVRKVH